MCLEFSVVLGEHNTLIWGAIYGGYAVGVEVVAYDMYVTGTRAPSGDSALPPSVKNQRRLQRPVRVN